MIKVGLVCLTLLLTVGLCDNLYHKIIHNYDPEAKCLDGTPGLLYLHEGDPKKILIFFEGGGLCGEETFAKTLESCYNRSKTLLGSSTPWPETLPGEGYLSTDPNKNVFAGWTKFILGYCDGSLHQGNNPNPVKYKDATLYFRGAAITRSHFDWINSKYPFAQAEKIVLTGGSAGGVGTFLWNNYFLDYVNRPGVVYSIPDSGVFINTKTQHRDDKIEKMIKNLFTVANPKEKTPFKECNNKYPGEEWRCLFIESAVEQLRGKFMVVNSQYDAWAISNILELHCMKRGTPDFSLEHCTRGELALIEKYRSSFKEVMTRLIASNPESSIWAISCAFHVYACLDALYDSPLEKIPMAVGSTARQAVEQFVMENKRVIDYDTEGWPHNQPCAKV